MNVNALHQMIRNLLSRRCFSTTGVPIRNWKKHESVSVSNDSRGVVRVSMQRPELHNAFNEKVIGELTSAFGEIKTAASSDTVRVVVLTGEGRTFSAGADLAWMQGIAKYSADENREDSRRLFDMFHSIKTCPAPVLGRINGSGLGGGAGLVSVCDIAYSIEKAQFGFTEVKLGLIPAVISPFVMEKIGASQCMRWFLTGEKFSASRAKQIGLLNETFATMEELDSSLEQLINELLTASPAAVRAAKQLTHTIANPAWLTRKEYVCGEIAKIRVSPEGQEGLQAFLNKRTPAWILSTEK